MGDWWRTTADLLGSDYAQIYRLDPEATRREVDAILAMSAAKPRASVLDLCCGVGRHAVEFARRGFEVAGLDISPIFLDMGRQKAAQAGVEVTWVEGDMRDIPFEDRFDLVVDLFGAWGYFDTDTENEQVFGSVARALRKGGRFVLDFFNHDWIIRHFQPCAWWEAGGLHCLERRHFDIYTGRHETTLVIIDESGNRREVNMSVRGYTFVEIKAMLERAGFHVLEAYGDYDRRPFSLETPRLIIVAAKPE